jgi:hypothetical protein
MGMRSSHYPLFVDYSRGSVDVSNEVLLRIPLYTFMISD